MDFTQENQALRAASVQHFLERAALFPVNNEAKAWLGQCIRIAKALPGNITEVPMAEQAGVKAWILKNLNAACKALDDGDLKGFQVHALRAHERYILLQEGEAIGQYLAIVEGRSKGGAKGGGHNRKIDPEKLRNANAELLAAGTEQRDVAAKLAARFGVTARTIRNHLNKKAESD